MTDIPEGPEPSFYVPDEVKVYKTAAGTDLTAHIFRPDKKSEQEINSAFVFFHPGGWTMGEPAWGYDLCRHFASKGMFSVSFQYRLSSIGGFSPVDALKDVKSAVRWTRKNAEEFNIDPQKIAAGAISAGAHLSTCAASIDGFDDESDDLSISPVPDVLVLQSAVLNTAIISDFSFVLQGREKPESLSPVHHIKPGLPPMCLIHGMSDDLVPFDSAEEYALKTAEAGNRCDLHPFENTDHFFGNVDGSEVFKIIEEFFKSTGLI